MQFTVVQIYYLYSQVHVKWIEKQKIAIFEEQIWQFQPIWNEIQTRISTKKEKHDINFISSYDCILKHSLLRLNLFFVPLIFSSYLFADNRIWITFYIGKCNINEMRRPTTIATTLPTTTDLNSREMSLMKLRHQHQCDDFSLEYFPLLARMEVYEKFHFSAEWNWIFRNIYKKNSRRNNDDFLYLF